MFLLSSVLLFTSAVAYAQKVEQCQNPRIRKSWHNLNNDERAEYIRAVKCLQSTPSKGTSIYPVIESRYEDFASLHMNQTSAPDKIGNNRGVVGPGIHFNGVFLPWHRYLLWTYENALIEECNYDGAQPYWDWSIDTPENGRTLNQSILFDPVTGFGGNGVDGSTSTPNTTVEGLTGSCVTDGPFANFTTHLGPGYSLNQSSPHCLIRNFNSSLYDDTCQWNTDIIPLLSVTNYTEFYLGMTFAVPGLKNVFGRGIHGGGHTGVGGEMQNLYSSPNDPLFYMHHGGVDYIWWLWQTLSTDNFNAMYGPIFPNGTGITTLEYPIYMAEYVAPDAQIGDVMDTLNKDGTGFLCYTYEDAGHPLPGGANRTDSASRRLLH